MYSAFLLSLLVVPFIAAQNATNNTALEIETIEANFQNAGLLQSLLTSFDPSFAMNVSFNGVGALSPGQNLTQSQVATAPNLTITPANSSVLLGGVFTLTMVDADTVGTDDTKPITRHWLVNSVTLSNSTAPNSVTVNYTSATSITDYAGPAPAPGSGSHRYTILLYTQPSNFTAPANLSSHTGVDKWTFQDYIKSTGLEGPVAGFYFQVENGTATASVSATSAVVISTLPAATATGSGSGAATPTKTGAAERVKYPAALTVGIIAIGLIL